jgi:hypothetical protein
MLEDPRKTQQLRAHGEVGAVDLLKIDDEGNAAGLDGEGNHASHPRETLAFSHEQYWREFPCAEKLLQFLVFETDEGEVAGKEFGRITDAHDVNLATLDEFAAHNRTEGFGQHVFAEDAELPFAGLRRDYRERPVDELRQLKEEGGANLLLGSGSLGAQRQKCQQHENG